LTVGMTLCTAVACWYLANRADAPLMITAGLVIAFVGLWGARTLPADSQVVQLKAANLPGAPDERAGEPPRWPYGWAAVATVGFLTFSFIAGTFALPAWIFVVLALVLAAVLVPITVPYAEFSRHHGAILEKFRQFRPVFTMPYDGQTGFHIGLWSPYLERAGHPFAVITTDPKAFRRVAQMYQMPVIFAPNGDQRAIRAMLPPSVRAAFYVFNGRNDKFIKIRSVTHVFVHHGDSDKGTSFKRKSAAYDVLVVAGQAAIDRYAAHGVDVPRQKFKILGRPQVEDIKTVTHPISSVEKPVVLYAPTWYSAGYTNNHSSLPIGAAIVSALLARGATVIFRPHPARRNLRESAAAIGRIQELLRADAAVTSRPHRWGPLADEPTFAELANAADAMVADVSGVVTDFLQSLKPFAMVSPGATTDEFRSEFPSSRAAYVIEWNLSTLDEALNLMLGEDPLEQVRRERRDYYLGGYDDGESAKAFVCYVQSLADGGQALLVPKNARPERTWATGLLARRRQ
jgi:hypothetical protein